MSSEQKRKQQQPNDDYDGEPGCRTLQEVNQMYRNYWDPTAYWHCEAQARPAVLKRCPPTQLFLDAKGHCINYTDWYWTEPSNPPSKPATNNTH